MKKEMTLWQMAAGCLLCALIFSSAFFSRITISPDRVLDCMVSILENMKNKYSDELSDYVDMEDVEKGLDEIKRQSKDEDIYKDFEETFGFTKLTCSSFQIMFASEGSVEEYLDNLTEDKGSDEVKELAPKVHSALFWLRVMLFVIYLAPILLMLLYVLSYRNRWKKTAAIFGTWAYFLFAALSAILWFFIIPNIGAGKLVDGAGKSVSGLGGGLGMGMAFLGSSIKGLVRPMLRSAVFHFTGMGEWIFLIGSVLIFLYSFALLFMGKGGSISPAAAGGKPVGRKPAGGSVADDDFFLDDILENNISPEEPDWDLDRSIPIMGNRASMRNPDMMTYSGEQTAYVNRRGQAMPPADKGTIRIVKGSLRGAEITCNPGEKIVVGRDPSSCNLILSHPKISRKHLVIQYAAGSGCYELYCFSKNGVGLSTGGRIGMSQSASIAKGTKLVLADGEEVMVLE